MNADSVKPVASLWIDPQYSALFARHGLQTIDDMFARTAAERFEKASLPSWRERVAIELLDESGTVTRFFVKRFHEPPGRVQRRRMLTGHGHRSTAGIERHWIESMRRDGLPVPHVAAFGEEMTGTREARSVLVLADVGGVSLERWASDRAERVPREMVGELANLVARFHRHGYIHRDLYLSHVFLVEQSPTTWRFALIDLQRVMHSPLRTRRWQARDLAQLHYSTPLQVAGPRERLRFLRTYLDEGLKGKAARDLIRRIERKAARIARHDARRRRALVAGDQVQ